MEKKIQTVFQATLFDEGANRCQALPRDCRNKVEQLLTQLLIQTVLEKSANAKKENANASEN